MKYKLGLHELHPSIDWRTKHFIMNIVELKGESAPLESSEAVFHVYVSFVRPGREDRPSLLEDRCSVRNFLLLVVMPGATSSVLAPSSDALCS